MQIVTLPENPVGLHYNITAHSEAVVCGRYVFPKGSGGVLVLTGPGSPVLWDQWYSPGLQERIYCIPETIAPEWFVAYSRALAAARGAPP